MKKAKMSHSYWLLLYYAHVRPCTPIKNVYAHIIVRPWAYMGVHVRPQKNPNNFLWAYNVRPCMPMYTHVRPWAYICVGVQIFYQCTMYAHVRPQKKMCTPTKILQISRILLKI